jgi:rRNA maturation protein Nop10
MKQLCLSESSLYDTTMAAHCFHCSSDLSSVTVNGRIAFRETCPKCGSAAHACRNCAFFDPGAHHECRETQAEYVKDKERENRCDYFRPGGNEKTPKSGGAADTLKALDDLFKK